MVLTHFGDEWVRNQDWSFFRDFFNFVDLSKGGCAEIVVDVKENDLA